jgi:hypothetical protein
MTNGASLTTMSVFGGPVVVSPNVASQFGNAAWGPGRWDYRAL